jgi:hypothetical protein
MPALAIPLGLLALVPFVVFAAAAVGQNAATSEHALFALIDYAALVLGFAGGVHWGLALLPEAVRPSLRLAAGLLPLVVAWIALVLAQLLAPWVAVSVLAAGYLATVLTEHRAAPGLLVPAGYMWLRWAVSLVAVAMLGLVLVLRFFGQTIVF